MSSFFREASTAYTPTDNAHELRAEASADRLVPEIHGLYAIDAVYPGLRESDPAAFRARVADKCPYFSQHYSGVLDVWMKSPKEKRVFLAMVQALKRIETGELSQHEASQVVGSTLQSFVPRELDVDAPRPDCVQPATRMTWTQWKDAQGKTKD